MYNLNVSLAAPQLLGVGPSTVSCTTPRTPEILNSVIAMTNPMDTYQQHHQQNQTNHQVQNHQLTQQYNLADSLQPQILTNDPSAGSNSDSSAVSPEGTNSVQKTCSLLIKAGLKLTIQSKRKMSGGDSSGNETSKSNRKDTINSMDTSDDDDDEKSTSNGLTPEDEERRRRRRERNKIAATKCRMKKRERTLNLVSESEILEMQNIELKNQERALESERRILMEALQSHSTACILPGGYQAPPLLNKQNGCCNGTNGSLSSIKNEPTFKATSGRGRRGNGTRGRAAGRGGGGRGGGSCRKVKQEPVGSPIGTENINNLPTSTTTTNNNCTSTNNNNHSTSNGLSSAPPVTQLPHFTGATDPFYPKYSPMDESPSLDYYSYDGTLTSVVADAAGNCANYLLKSPTRSIDSMTTALNDLSNSSNFSYPLATPVALVNGNGGHGGVANGMAGLQASPLIKNDIYIPNCENSNDLLQCTNPVGGHMLYNDTDSETKLNDLTLNGNGMVNNLSCYEESPLFSVFC